MGIYFNDTDKLQVKKLTHYLDKGLRPMWRSFAAAAHAFVQAGVCVCVCVGGDGVPQELGNIDMVVSTPPSQKY